jgi:hypothetical protein
LHTKQQQQQDEYVPIATSPTIELYMTETPTNLHLSLGDNPTTMMVQFTTGSSGTPVAMYGETSPTTKVEGTSLTYQASEMCGAPANSTTGVGEFVAPGMLHSIALTNLKPNTHYTYKVGVTFGQGIVWSDTFSLTSAPKVGSSGSSNSPYTYVVYGDQGCPSVGWGQGGEWTAAMVARESDLWAVHHFGYLSYARGAAHIWDEWLTMVAGFATRIPLMIAVGNHVRIFCVRWFVAVCWCQSRNCLTYSI